MLLFLCCIVLGAGSKVLELNADHFQGHGGQFEHHPVQGHKYAMVLFYDSNTSLVLLSEYQLAARTVAAQGLASKVMLGQLQGDKDENKVLVDRFKGKRLPFLAWQTKGNQKWSGRRLGRAETLLAEISSSMELETKLTPTHEETHVNELNLGHFRGDAGQFIHHPVRGHKYAMVLFYDSSTSSALLSEYQVVARAVAANVLESQVMIGQLKADADPKKLMVERFQLEQLPSILWLTEDDPNWEVRVERKAEDLVAHIEFDTKLKPGRDHDEM